MASLFSRTVYRYGHIRKFPLYLQRFVSIIFCCTVDRHLLESLALSLVSSGEHGYVLVSPFLAFKEHPQYHFGMWGLSGTAYGDVAYADGRDFSLVRSEESDVICYVPAFEYKPIWKEK